MEHGLYWFDFVGATGEEVSLARDSEAKLRRQYNCNQRHDRSSTYIPMYVPCTCMFGSSMTNHACLIAVIDAIVITV